MREPGVRARESPGDHAGPQRAGASRLHWDRNLRDHPRVWARAQRRRAPDVGRQGHGPGWGSRADGPRGSAPGGGPGVVGPKRDPRRTGPRTPAGRARCAGPGRPGEGAGLAGARALRWVPGAGPRGRQVRAGTKRRGGRRTWARSGAEPSTSQVANRFMGTGVLERGGRAGQAQAAPLGHGAGPRRPLGGLLRPGRGRAAGGRAGQARGEWRRRAVTWPAGRRGRPGGRRTGPRAATRLRAAPPPPRPRARARRARLPRPRRRRPLAGRALSPTPAQSRPAEAHREVRFARPPAGDPEAPTRRGPRERASRLRTGPAQSAPRPRGRQGGAGGTPGSSRATLSPAAPAPASASPRPPELCIPESACPHALPRPLTPPFLAVPRVLGPDCLDHPPGARGPGVLRSLAHPANPPCASGVPAPPPPS